MIAAYREQIDVDDMYGNIGTDVKTDVSQIYCTF